MALIDSRKIYLNGKTTDQVLVHWSDSQSEDASWEDFQQFTTLFPSIINERMEIFEEGGDDTVQPTTREVAWEVARDLQAIQEQKGEGNISLPEKSG